MTPQQLVIRRQEIRDAMRDLDVELTAIEGALAMYGARRQGRPRKPDPYTPDEAREAHRLYGRGDRRPWVVKGHQQYMRTSRRLTRARA